MRQQVASVPQGRPERQQPVSRRGEGVSCPSTAADRCALSEVWPEVERSLRAFLRRRGVPLQAVDDLVQDVAIAAVAQRVAFSGAEDLLRWARVVAERKHWRDATKGRRIDLRDVPPEVPAVENVEAQAIARRELAVVVAAAERLEPRHQEAFTAGATRRGPKRDRDRVALRVHRARKVLRARSRRFIGIAAPLRAPKWLAAGSPQAVAVFSATAVAIGLALGPLTTPADQSKPDRARNARFVGVSPSAGTSVAHERAGSIEASPTLPRVPEEAVRPRKTPVAAVRVVEDAEVGTKDNDGAQPLLCYRGRASPEGICLSLPEIAPLPVP